MAYIRTCVQHLGEIRRPVRNNCPSSLIIDDADGFDVLNIRNRHNISIYKFKKVTRCVRSFLIFFVCLFVRSFVTFSSFSSLYEHLLRCAHKRMKVYTYSL